MDQDKTEDVIRDRMAPTGSWSIFSSLRPQGWSNCDRVKGPGFASGSISANTASVKWVALYKGQEIGYIVWELNIILRKSVYRRE